MEDKLNKLEAQLDKLEAQFNKVMDNYRKDTEMQQYIPFSVFNNFRKLSNTEKENIQSSYWSSYNPEALQGYYKAAREEAGFQDIKDKYYYDYYCKANELFERILNKNRDINTEREKIQKKLDKAGAKIAVDLLVEDLFKKIPELKTFIDNCTDKQYQYLINRNEKLKKAWARYKEAVDIDYQEAQKLKPTHFVRSEEDIQKDVDSWRINESRLMANRIKTEFGDIISTEFWIGDDGNVNGIIEGSLKTARIETIYAGGYNIQCLHTRLLIHEK